MLLLLLFIYVHLDNEVRRTLPPAQLDASVIRTIYNRLFRALDETSFFSARPHVMSNYTVIGSPSFSDITRIVDAIQVTDEHSSC